MIGKWNPSVILTYIGLACAVAGIILAADLKCSVILLMTAGLCDLFDGVVARRVKRNEEEKLFGVQIDSLVDAVSFIALPIALIAHLVSNLYVMIPVSVFYAICGVARLGFFNIKTEGEGPVKYYRGLPVTYSALIFPLAALLFKFVTDKGYLAADSAVYLLPVCLAAVGFLYILDFKAIKPRGKAYIFFLLLYIAMFAYFIAI